MKIKPFPTLAVSHQETTIVKNELERIEKECIHLTGQIDQNQAELTTLAERESQRTEQEARAQATIDEARQSYQEAKVRAELLTTGELAKAVQKELNHLESQLRAAQDAQMKTLDRIGKEADADSRKVQRFQEAIERDTESIQRLEERKCIAEGLKQKALFEHAEATLRAHLDTVKAMQTQRDQQQSILASMESEIEEYKHLAYKELASYPEQQSAFSANFVYTDTLTDILQAQIAFLDLVLTTGRSVPEIPIAVTRQTHTTWQGLAELLSLDVGHFRPALARESRAIPAVLVERRDLLTKLLGLYREEKA